MLSFAGLDESDLVVLDEIKPEDWQSIVPIHRMYLKAGCCLPVKALMNGSIAGIGTVIDYGRTAWLAHIIVDTKHRNKGVGTALVSHLLHRIDSIPRIKSVSLTATDLGYPLYVKQGFTTETEYIIFTRSHEQVPAATADAVRPVHAIDYDELYQIDTQGSGETRRGLLESVCKDALVYPSAGPIEGYYLPGFGEGPIIARTKEAGLSLLEAKIKTCLRIVVPASNNAAGEYLKKQGLLEEKRIPRMIRGESFLWRQDWNYSRIGGFAG
ncbi:MAG: GNAT family N-acetyltransferase [Spirochaetales bacterium]|nr:GNAT family N-acetyltransferase [Spirochaetales bacterium]